MTRVEEIMFVDNRIGFMADSIKSKIPKNNINILFWKEC